MTRAIQLLVSVRDAEEAAEAVAGGADWIDLKEPRRGPLGAVDVATARDVVARVAGKAPVSAAGGELIDWRTGGARSLLHVAGLSHVKLGLAGCRGADWTQVWLAAQGEAAARGIGMVAVIYADAEAALAPPAVEVLMLAVDARCEWLLLDTFDKRSGTLLDALDAEPLRALLAAARAGGLSTAVAGRLTPELVRSLPPGEVDMVGVRSAACGGDRQGRVRRTAVATFCQSLRPPLGVGATETSQAPARPSDSAFFAAQGVS